MKNLRKNVFLVDDDMTNLTVGKNALSDSYNVFTLSSGEDMLGMLENVTPDLILLDVNMPNMDGYEVIRRLKSIDSTADIPVIFLTSLNDEDKELKGLSLGAIDYITKPFSAPLLLKRLEVHLLVESQKKELQAQKHELLFLNKNLEQLVEDKIRTVVELKNAILSTLAELVEHRDENTGGHIEMTQKYVKVLLDSMKKHNVYAKEVASFDEELVLQSCLLHDVGKIAISDTILLKESKLTPEEYSKIKTHTTFGEKIINKIKEKTTDSDFLEYARIVAISHHEKWDGSGYPYGLAGEEIPLIGRIMAIADVYDALVSHRPYKDAFPHEIAMKIIVEDKFIHFDPALTEVFEKEHSQFKQISAANNLRQMNNKNSV